jgi:hypothetical protein
MVGRVVYVHYNEIKFERRFIMSKLEIIKKVGGFIVSMGVGAIVNNAVKATTPIFTHPIKRVCIAIGTVVLGAMISDKAVQYTEKTIDETAIEIKKAVHSGELN